MAFLFKENEGSKKNVCLERLEALIIMHPKRSPHVTSRTYLEEYEETVQQCSHFFPYMRKMEASLESEGITSFNEHIQGTEQTTMLSNVMMAEHGSILDSSVKHDMLLKRPFHFLKHYWLR